MPGKRYSLRVTKGPFAGERVRPTGKQLAETGHIEVERRTNHQRLYFPMHMLKKIRGRLR